MSTELTDADLETLANFGAGMLIAGSMMILTGLIAPRRLNRSAAGALLHMGFRIAILGLLAMAPKYWLTAMGA